MAARPLRSGVPVGGHNEPLPVEPSPPSERGPLVVPEPGQGCTSVAR